MNATRLSSTSKPRGWLLLLAGLGLAAVACGSDDPDPAPAGSGGGGGAVALTRVQNCATIDAGVKGISSMASKASSSDAGAGGASSGGPSLPTPPANASASACEGFLSGCSDADIAAIAPEYDCYARQAGSATSLEELQKACPSSAQLSDACNSSISALVPASKAACANPQACWYVVEHFNPSTGGCDPSVGEPGHSLCIAWLDTWCTFAWYLFTC